MDDAWEMELSRHESFHPHPVPLDVLNRTTRPDNRDVPPKTHTQVDKLHHFPPCDTEIILQRSVIALTRSASHYIVQQKLA